MTLDEYIVAAIKRVGLNGLTLWRTRNGWQASVRKDGSDGFSIAIDEDPVKAIRVALIGFQTEAFPEARGFGEDGPVSDTTKRLYLAFKRNVMSRATAEPEDDGL